MEKSKFIQPKKLQGFWELMPKEQIAFSSMLEKIEKVFKHHSFLPLDTPVLEYSETLLAKSGGDTDKEVYRFTKGSNDVCMRYDLTVPLARFVAMNKNILAFPFKRFQIGKVYRGERPQKGRFREFYQCDADIIGNETLSLVADAETIYLFEKCYEALDLDVTINLSNRKITAGFIQSINQEENTTAILTVLDKLAKIEESDAICQLKEIGLDENQTKQIISLAKTKGTLADVLAILNDMKEKNSDLSNNLLFVTGISELAEVANYLSDFGSTKVIANLCIIRGHNYYTGSVFEAFITGKENLGAVGAGGRFENLCGYFSDKNMPGVGMSVGVTRLFDIMTKENLLDSSDINETQCAIVTFDDTLRDGLSLVSKLRAHGIKAECLYEAKTFKAKMKEADRRKINYVLILGETEVQTQNYTLKNMLTSEQKTCSFEEIVKTITSERM